MCLLDYMTASYVAIRWETDSAIRSSLPLNYAVPEKSSDRIGNTSREVKDEIFADNNKANRPGLQL